MKTAPKVSIVVTTYNRAKTLGATLDSVLAQSFTDYELIVSDDRSPDNTAELCRSYEAKDARVRYFCNEKNLKMPGNLNAAIGRARGEYIANLHDGDCYRPDLIEKWVHALDKHPSAAFVFNDYLTRIGSRERIHRPDNVAALSECMNGQQFLRDVFVSQWGSPIFGTVMARKACYDAVGPFNPKYSFNSDVEMWARLASRYDVAYVAEPLIELTPRESKHLLSGHAWWELTIDVRIKRETLRTLEMPLLERLLFEARARKHYARQALPALRHGRWDDAKRALVTAATGNDNVPPPY